MKEETYKMLCNVSATKKLICNYMSVIFKNNSLNYKVKDKKLSTLNSVKCPV